MKRDAALNGLKIVECGGLVSAAYASKLFADLGAEVIKVEPPWGDPARLRGPFPGKSPDLNASGLFIYLNCNKRGVTADLATAEGQELLQALVRDADMLIHNVSPNRVRHLGLEYEGLARANPRLVEVSVTPFGLRGPHRTYEASDLTLWAAGGLAYLNGAGPGSDDLPPLKPFGLQAEFQGALNAAVAGLGALFARRKTGVGQHVVVSIQQCVASILELTFEYYPYMGLIASRLGQKPIQPLDFFECRDGWIFVCCVEEHQWHSLVELMGNPDWAQLEIFADRLSRARNWDALKLLIQEWMATQSVAELYHAGQSRRIPLAPVSTMGDLLNSDHLRARGFFATIEQPGAGRTTFPGAPYQLSATPWKLRRPAPKLGEHNQQVIEAMGRGTPWSFAASATEATR
ncbi:MAG: CoA transferase [Candidatus Binatia bacterium]|nr:MAG: CoA transferase [Candidatus Binatia bacterium]